MRMEDLTPVQRIGLMQAIYKVVAAEVSTKDPKSARSVIDADMIDRYERTGAKSYDIRYGDVKAGTYSVRVSKPKSTTVYDLADAEAFDSWLATEDAHDMRESYVSDHMEDFVRYVCEVVGEVPDGVEPRTVETPEQVAGTTIQIKPELVAEALRGSLSPAIVGLLGGGVDG